MLSDKPELHQLLNLSYTDDNGREKNFRFMDRIRPHWRKLAVALRFPSYTIATIENEDDQMYFLLSKWLEGENRDNDQRPVTWLTLISALRDANIQEDATILETLTMQESALEKQPGI